MTVRLGRDEAINFWDQRHQAYDPALAGGDIGLEAAENRAFYIRRLGRLLEVLGESSPQGAPRTVLDAGCGTGFFARGMTECGFRVVGVDSSASAIATARTIGGGPTYVEAALDEFWWDHQFDHVVSIDVLFHITDDDAFRQSTRRLAHHVRFGGTLIIADRLEEQPVRLSDYIIHRPREEYDELLSPLGFHFQDALPYAFPKNPIHFLRYERHT